ncbi:Fic family protein [Noviherbaspirillum sedimenti]|uniref:Fic family protein n=1 Tax=Noviherbaspirillum sedimenti TaxID=2320865 RepID=A0A3A3FWU5_9BURK|nr:Fic family protein [Noviherbaspirillum sedimenti]RJG00204.1 Fic family protein [Noviherbaspirillum sedimenti]
MSAIDKLLQNIQAAPAGLSLAELLPLHPGLARRTAQRLISRLLAEGKIRPGGAGRARRYFATHTSPEITSGSGGDAFPNFIPLSADSRDILAYIDQPHEARTPVGYQREFLDAYQPNDTWYLSAPLRRQLHKIGKTPQTEAPAGTYSRAILNRLLIDLSWASSHLEGNTYSRIDTRELIEHGKAAQGKATIETQMILNHKTAIELLVGNIDTAEFNRYTVMNLHSALAENLLPNPADEGRIRQHAVDIGKSVYRPLSTPQQLDDLLDILLEKANRIVDPFEQSFFMMVHLPYLQPFADINKRTSRLAANLPLFRANLCPLTFLDVPEQAYSRAILGVYELTRVELLRDLYVWAYERSAQEYRAIRQELAEPDPLRLAWRDLIKQTIREVVTQPGGDALAIIRRAVDTTVPEAERGSMQALIVEELRRLHEGVLARYGLRPSEFAAWKENQFK